MTTTQITEAESKILTHSLGINLKDKFPSKPYRNRFCASESHDDLQLLLSLEEKGMMKRGRIINDGRDTLWYVTDKGINRLKQLSTS